MRTWSRVVGSLLCATALVSCGGESDDPAAAGTALSASTVGGEVTGSGTDVLEPGAPCGGDGSYLWTTADQGEVRSYSRMFEGRQEEVVVGAWPMEEDAARDALRRIDYGQDCPPSGVSMEGAPGFDPPARAIDIMTREAQGQPLVSWAARAYTYADGHMVTAWIQTDGERPSYDSLRELVDEQVAAL